MLKQLSLLFIIGTTILFSSCETEFSLNGDYKRIPVVFGLLDHHETTHFIKITRTFLGDGNNFDFAQIADSSYFDQVDAQIIELNSDNTETGRKWQLHDTLITNKESGTFYGPEQKMYVFYEADLDSSKQYKLVADLDEGTYSLDAKTKLLPNFRYGFQIEQTGFRFSFNPNNSSGETTYGSFNLVFDQAKNGALYESRIIFNYRETYADGSTSVKSIPWLIYNKEQDNPNSPTTIQHNVGGADFYNLLKDNIASNSDVIKREIIGLDLTTSIADVELAKYMEISAPTSSLSQATPHYTNVNSEVGALGLFSSRHTVILENIQLSSKTVEEVCTGAITGGLGFCSSLSEHNGESFYCN